MQILVILLGISGILAAGCFGAFGLFFNAMGSWVVGVPMLLIGGAIGYFSIRQLFPKFLMSSPTESAMTESFDAAKALLGNADAGDAEALFQCGAHFENGSGGFAFDRALAKDCYRRVAALGQTDAMKRLKLLDEDPLDILNQSRRRLRRS